MKILASNYNNIKIKTYIIRRRKINTIKTITTATTTNSFSIMASFEYMQTENQQQQHNNDSQHHHQDNNHQQHHSISSAKNIVKEQTTITEKKTISSQSSSQPSSPSTATPYITNHHQQQTITNNKRQQEKSSTTISSSSLSSSSPTTTSSLTTTTSTSPSFDLPPITESIIIDIPSSAASIASSTYDTTDASSTRSSRSCRSTTSSTCCTGHGERIYMQQRISSAQQQQQHHLQQSMQLQSPFDVEILHAKADRRKSWPIFILLISIIEIAIFAYDLFTVQPQLQDLPVPIPTDSVFIYRPDRRLEVWRFVSYMLLHANWFHLGFNVVVQLFYGIPLEVMHGSARVAIIYFAGVFAGSLGTSVVDSEVYLVGASGGVYALLAAHLANITLNYGQMRYAVAQLVSVVIFVSCDLGYAFYTQYLSVIELSTAPPVSYIAHLTGALAGLTIGLLVLKNFERRAYENIIWWLALGVYSAFTLFAIVFNLINTVTAQLMEEQGEVITQHLLHDLGVS